MARSKTIGTKQAGVQYEERRAVRTIIQDAAEAKIILIFVEKGQYYKLPGGGIEADEDHALAAEREALEETGCVVKIDGGCFATSGMFYFQVLDNLCADAAVIEEWRNDLHQISYCYMAKMIKDTGAPDLTELEKSEGLSFQWYSPTEAIELMQGAKPTSKLGEYIKERDLFFVKQFIHA